MQRRKFFGALASAPIMAADAVIDTWDGAPESARALGDAHASPAQRVQPGDLDCRPELAAARRVLVHSPGAGAEGGALDFGSRSGLVSRTPVSRAASSADIPASTNPLNERARPATSAA